jgi:elongation factor P
LLATAELSIKAHRIESAGHLRYRKGLDAIVHPTGVADMLKASQLHKGHVVNIGGAAYQVKQVDTQTPSARGANTLYRVRLTGITTGQNLDQTFKSNDTLDEMMLERRSVSYLYRDQETFHFMDEIEIVETAPVIKGATATNRNKPATLTNGRVVLVPDRRRCGGNRPGWSWCRASG